MTALSGSAEGFLLSVSGFRCPTTPFPPQDYLSLLFLECPGVSSVVSKKMGIL